MYNRDNLLESLTEIFKDTFDDSSIELTDKTTADDIEDWDSLMQIRLLIAIEQKFSLRFNPIEISELENVGQMVSLLEKLLVN